MKKIKQLIILLMVLAMGILTACAGTKSNTTTEANSGTTEQMLTEISKDSILYFQDDEGSATLMQLFEEGNAPEEAIFMYDEMGANPEITITDTEEIQNLYQYLSMVTVAGETDESITDCYHYVQFKLDENRYANYSFEGTEIWGYDNQNYSIENSKQLFAYMNELMEKYAEQ